MGTSTNAIKSKLDYLTIYRTNSDYKPIMIPMNMDSHVKREIDNPQYLVSTWILTHVMTCQCHCCKTRCMENLPTFG